MRYLWIGLLVLSVVACGKSRRPFPDKTTSWLRACDRDAQCGDELACLCGICSRTCDNAASCSGDTRCISSNDPDAAQACGDDPATPALCASTCRRDSECRELGDDFTCRRGLCSAPAASSPPPEPTPPACDQPSCVPDPVIACTDGEANLKLCDFVSCTGLNETAVTLCEDGHFSTCECVVPRDRCAATDCAAGYACYAGKCLETARCSERACDEGWTCWDGSVCGKTLASDQHRPNSLASDDGALYFANGGTFGVDGSFNGDSSIEKIVLDTGEQMRIAEDKNPIRDLIVRTGRAYWFSEGRPDAFQLMTLTLRDGVPNALISGIGFAESLATDVDNLYWFDRSTTGASRLMRAAQLDGGVQSQLLATLVSPTDLVLYREQIYFTDEQKLWRVNPDGSDLKQVAEPDKPGRWPRHLSADDDAIYWLWWDEGNATGTSIYNEDSGLGETLGMDENSLTTNAAFAIAASGNTVFWLFASSEGYVILNRTDKQTGETRYVWGTPRLTVESRILVDEGSIYLTSPGTDSGDGEVLRLVRRW
ncbi:MAG TPA: hypothetical protein VFG30_29365 [Polyangiales bacterium]|nr:hypothetical protein [Polyangiales bacterium]